MADLEPMAKRIIKGECRELVTSSSLAQRGHALLDKLSSARSILEHAAVIGPGNAPRLRGMRRLPHPAAAEYLAFSSDGQVLATTADTSGGSRSRRAL